MTARRLAMTLLGLAVVGAVALAAGPRSGLLVAIGIGFGLVLEGLRFGFAGPWRLMIAERDARGLIAQVLAIGLAAAAHADAEHGVFRIRALGNTTLDFRGGFFGQVYHLFVSSVWKGRVLTFG